MAKSSPLSKSKQKGSPATKPKKKRKRKKLFNVAQSVTIQTRNTNPPGAPPFLRNRDFVVTGIASVPFQFVSGRLDLPGVTANLAPTTVAGNGNNWSLTWAANSIPGPGQHLLTVFIIGGSATDAELDTFACWIDIPDHVARQADRLGISLTAGVHGAAR